MTLLVLLSCLYISCHAATQVPPTFDHNEWWRDMVPNLKFSSISAPPTWIPIPTSVWLSPTLPPFLTGLFDIMHPTGRRDRKRRDLAAVSVTNTTPASDYQEPVLRRFLKRMTDVFTKPLPLLRSTRNTGTEMQTVATNATVATNVTAAAAVATNVAAVATNATTDATDPVWNQTIGQNQTATVQDQTTTHTSEIDGYTKPAGTPYETTPDEYSNLSDTFNDERVKENYQNNYDDNVIVNLQTVHSQTFASELPAGNTSLTLYTTIISKYLLLNNTNAVTKKEYDLITGEQLKGFVLLNLIRYKPEGMIVMIDKLAKVFTPDVTEDTLTQEFKHPLIVKLILGINRYEVCVNKWPVDETLPDTVSGIIMSMDTLASIPIPIDSDKSTRTMFDKYRTSIRLRLVKTLTGSDYTAVDIMMYVWIASGCLLFVAMTVTITICVMYKSSARSTAGYLKLKAHNNNRIV